MSAVSARTRTRARRTVLAVLGAALAGAGVIGPAYAWASAGPTSTDVGQQWGLAQIHAPAAWADGTGTGVRIGIVDTGVDMGHPELAGKVVAAATCMNTGGDASQCVSGGNAGEDDNGHGTHVAGIAAAAGVHVAGVAPGASLVVAKVLDSSGSGNTADVAAGIAWVVQHGARVVNLSLGSDTGVLGLNCVLGDCGDAPITPAVEDAWQAGAIPVIAAGNNAGNLFGPSGYGGLDAVVVAATGPTGQMASYSSTPGNAKWGVLAPGGDDPNGPSTPTCGAVDQDEILSTYWSGGSSCYATDEGTSMATPFVSGTLALLLGRGLSPEQAVDTLLSTLDRSVTCGTGGGCQGLVDAAAAMAAAGSPPSPGSTAPASAAGSGVGSGGTAQRGHSGVGSSGRAATSGRSGTGTTRDDPPGVPSPSGPGASVTAPLATGGAAAEGGAGGIDATPSAGHAPLPLAIALVVLGVLVAAAWSLRRRFAAPTLRAVHHPSLTGTGAQDVQSDGSATKAATPSPMAGTSAGVSGGARRG